MTASEIDELARKRAMIMTDDLLEVGLWYRLVKLYDSYDETLIPEIGARKAKQDLISVFEEEQRQRRIYFAEAQRRVKISPLMSDANIRGCEICKRISAIYDGRERI